jgi:hypothetical protein
LARSPSTSTWTSARLQWRLFTRASLSTSPIARSRCKIWFNDTATSKTISPEELRDDALPYFIDWLLKNVHLLEITAYSDDDAYTIFKTMNDRGLSLSPTDMLKGYLLANIAENKRASANTRWRDRVRELNDAGKEVEPDCFKAWLRSQYATKIRERKKGAKSEDFDRIGTEFHRWLRDAADTIGLKQSDDFYRFIDRDFDFYSRQYLRLIEAEEKLVPGLEHVLYNAQHGFTLQNMLLLAPLRPEDDEVTVNRKLDLVARYLDILLTWRLWSSRTIAYSTMQYAMFVVMRDIRGLAQEALAQKLHDFLKREAETFVSNDRLRLHQQNRYALHRTLARITDYVETQSGQPSRYLDYGSEGKTRYEVEHIWAGPPRALHRRVQPPGRLCRAQATASAGCSCCPKASMPVMATSPTRTSCRNTTPKTYSPARCTPNATSTIQAFYVSRNRAGYLSNLSLLSKRPIWKPGACFTVRLPSASGTRKIW